MKIKIRIPTTSYAFIEAEGEEKELSKMIELHNKYCQDKLKENDPNSSAPPAKESF